MVCQSAIMWLVCIEENDFKYMINKAYIVVIIQKINTTIPTTKNPLPHNHTPLPIQIIQYSSKFFINIYSQYKLTDFYYCQIKTFMKVMSKHINKQQKDIFRLNKQNISRDNVDCFIQKQKKNIQRQQLLILKESALSVIIQKNKEIEDIMEKTTQKINIRQYHFVQEITELKERVSAIQNDKLHLLEEIKELQNRLQSQKSQYQKEISNFLEEIEEYKGQIYTLEIYNEEINGKFSDVINQSNELCYELKCLRQENCQLKIMFKKDRSGGLQFYESNLMNEYAYQNCRQSSKEVISDSVSIDFIQPKNSQDKVAYLSQNRYHERSQKEKTIQEIIYYETEQWFQNTEKIAYSRSNSPHCLKTSLKAMNIQNYSEKSKNNSDNQSQFTLKYFKYGSDNHFGGLQYHIQDSCQNIPEQTEEQLIAQTQRQNGLKQQKKELSKTWQNVGYFMGGAFVGALLFSKWW